MSHGVSIEIWSRDKKKLRVWGFELSRNKLKKKTTDNHIKSEFISSRKQSEISPVYVMKDLFIQNKFQHGYMRKICEFSQLQSYLKVRPSHLVACYDNKMLLRINAKDTSSFWRIISTCTTWKYSFQKSTGQESFSWYNLSLCRCFTGGS